MLLELFLLILFAIATPAHHHELFGGPCHHPTGTVDLDIVLFAEESPVCSPDWLAGRFESCDSIESLLDPDMAHLSPNTITETPTLWFGYLGKMHIYGLEL